MPTSTACLVHRRGPVFWFRKAVPVDLTDRLGCSDIRRSLRTSNVRVARQRAWSLVLVVEDAFETLRRSGVSPEARDVFARIIGAVIDDFDRGGRQPATRAKYRVLLDSLAPDNEGRTIGEIAGAYAGALPAPATTEESAALPVPAFAAGPPMELDTFAGMIQTAVAEAMKDAAIKPEARVLLSAKISDYLEFKKGQRRGAKYLDEIRTKLDIFLRTIGDRPVHSYSVLDMRGYRDLVDRMPKDAIKHLGTDDPRRAIALNARRRLPLPAIGETTVNAKYLSAVRGLFEYLLDEQIIDRSPMDGVRSEQKRDGHAQLLPSEVRLPFIAEHIIALRRIADRKPKWSVDRWWIRIMPRTGLRDEEIAELSVADFRVHHGRTCVDLLHLGDGDPINVQRREQLRLKSPAARRIIPLHRSLLEDGIMEFVEKRRREGGPLALLFPQEKPDKYGARSSAMSKRVNGQVDKVTEDPRYVAYSARHTFAAACDAAGVPERIRDRLMGHEPREHEDGNSRRARGSHVRSRYGSPILSAEEMSWIDKLKFPGDE